ncbi:hypothetical protein PSPO01_00372 [Paraphaeosphaeria sporulosa]
MARRGPLPSPGCGPTRQATASPARSAAARRHVANGWTWTPRRGARRETTSGERASLAPNTAPKPQPMRRRRSAELRTFRLERSGAGRCEGSTLERRHGHPAGAPAWQQDRAECGATAGRGACERIAYGHHQQQAGTLSALSRPANRRLAALHRPLAPSPATSLFASSHCAAPHNAPAHAHLAILHTRSPTDRPDLAMNLYNSRSVAPSNTLPSARCLRALSRAVASKAGPVRRPVVVVVAVHVRPALLHAGHRDPAPSIRFWLKS